MARITFKRGTPETTMTNVGSFSICARQSTREIIIYNREYAQLSKDAILDLQISTERDASDVIVRVLVIRATACDHGTLRITSSNVTSITVVRRFGQSVNLSYFKQLHVIGNLKLRRMSVEWMPGRSVSAINVVVRGNDKLTRIDTRGRVTVDAHDTGDALRVYKSTETVDTCNRVIAELYQVATDHGSASAQLLCMLNDKMRTWIFDHAQITEALYDILVMSGPCIRIGGEVHSRKRGLVNAYRTLLMMQRVHVGSGFIVGNLAVRRLFISMIM